MSGIADQDIELAAQQLILAAAQHDIVTIAKLLQTQSANVQDGETGYTPLHAAVAAFDLPDEGDVAVKPNEQELKAAEETIRLLLQNGAIWNDLDANNETPACIAWRCQLTELYDILVEAGLRAELLLNRLDEFEQLGSDASNIDDNEPSTELRVEPSFSGTAVEGATENDLVQLDATSEAALEVSKEDHLSNITYLGRPLAYDDDKLVDEMSNGVMMRWETDIMSSTADLLLGRAGMTCLNIGHGMGIVDSFFQEKRPVSHHIVEGHPDVLRKMRETGWYGKPNIVIHEGTWQDVLPKLAAKNETFDAIFYDTFAEDYKSFKEFFSEFVVTLLKPGGRWSFFNGLGADRQCAYDVYTKVVEIDLFEAGFDVEWTIIEVPDKGHATAQETIRHRYWRLENYRMPSCSFLS